jgi:hypothetical protein
MPEVFTNAPTGTVTAGGTTTTDTAFTVSPATAFPVAGTGPPAAWFRITDQALAMPTEIMYVSVCPGGTTSGQSWTVARAQEGSTAVAHAANWVAEQVVTAATLASFGQGAGGGGMSLAGLGLQLLTLNPQSVDSATVATSARLELALCTANASVPVSTLGTWYSGSSLAVSSPCELGLFSEAGTLLEGTADLSASIVTATDYTTLEGSITTVNVVQGTNYWLGLLFTGTAMPALADSTNSAAFGALNGHYLSLLVNSQTSMPGSFTPSTATGNTRIRMIWAR